MTYKKRKNVKKQSFKKRNKKIKGGGPDGDDNDAQVNKEETTAGTEGDAAGASTTTNEGDAANVKEGATTTEGDAAGTEVKEGATTTEGDAASDAATTEVKEGDDATVTDESAETPVADDSWKEGQSNEEIQQAENKVKEIEEMGKEEINNLAEELANAPGTPLWAKALAKSGAAGKVAEFLEEHPELKNALIDKGIKMVENANVSGGPKTTASTESSTTPAGNPEEDAGYKQFLEELKTNPDDTLRKNVYIWPSVEGLYVYDGEKWVNHKDEVIEEGDAAAAAGTEVQKEGVDAAGTEVKEGDAADTEVQKEGDAAGADAAGADAADTTTAATADTTAATADNKEGTGDQ